jgi:hypothetical protein
MQTYCSSDSTNLLPHKRKPEAPKCAPFNEDAAWLGEEPPHVDPSHKF